MNSLSMLLVEDNLADVVFFREALRAAALEAKVDVVVDGDDLFRFLRGQGPYAQASRPDVIVLDLNLPKKSGRDVLLEITADAALRTIPVAVLTTSMSEENVVDLYTPGLCAYFVKTNDLKELQGIVRQIASHAQLRI
jgi:two-component system, chemotaxis family, response regulator Rcp1